MAIIATVNFWAFVAQYGTVPDHFEMLFGNIKIDKQTWSFPQVSYLLATVKHETEHTFRSIEERSPLPPPAPAGATEEEGKRLRQQFAEAYFAERYEREPLRSQLGNIQRGDGYRYRGRGYVQLTGRANYTRFSSILHTDLIGNPDLALQPRIAYQVLSIGCAQGLFTGKRLSDYINDEKQDYVNARRVINGLDCAQRIAEYAEQFQRSLQLAAADTVRTGQPG